MNRKLKILHFMPENYVWGGIEVYLKHTLPKLRDRGNYEICAVVTQDSQLYHALKEAGITVWGIPFPLRKKSIFRSAWVNPWARCIDLSIYWHLIPILKREKPDLVHIHNGRLEQSIIRLAGFPMVYTYHGYAGPFNIEQAPNIVARFIYKIARPLFTSLLPFLSGMTIVSQYEKERLYREKFAPQNYPIQVIHNGLPIESIRNSLQNFSSEIFRQKLNIPPNVRVVSYICQLRRDKNPEAFLRIAKRVATHPHLNRSVYFLVAGDGKLAPVFKKAFNKDPILSQYGQYLGFRDDIAQIISASDLTVNTSLQEGFGLRILESLILGKPCLTYASGGIIEVLEFPEGKDWLVPIGNEDAFVEALVSAINQSDNSFLELSSILRQHAECFNLSQHVSKIEEFYKYIFTLVWPNPISMDQLTKDQKHLLLPMN